MSTANGNPLDRPTNTVIGCIQNGFLARMMHYSPPAVVVWLALANRADISGRCYPSIGTLQADTGLARSTVHRAISELVKAGEVAVDAGGGKGNPSNRYHIVGGPGNILVQIPNQSKSRTKVVREMDQGSTGNRPRVVREMDSNHTQEPNTETKHKNQTRSIAIPTSLDSEKFREVWDEFKKHRTESRCKMTPTAESRALKKLAGMGLERAIRALEHSTENGYRGIFEPSPSGNGRSGRRPIGPGQRHPADMSTQVGSF